MSTLGDILGFEKFNLKDMAKKIKKDPWRLAAGAVDPASTKLWNKVTGKKTEPLVDQMGGAYGGHTISAFGNTDGGVYQRAREADINTKAGGVVHDLAHVVSALYAGSYGAGKLKGLGESRGGEQGGWREQVQKYAQRMSSQDNPSQRQPAPRDEQDEDDEALTSARIAAAGTRQARLRAAASGGNGQLVSGWGVR